MRRRNSSPRQLLLLWLSACVLLPGANALAATLTVNNAPGCDDMTGSPYCTIQAAVNAAAAGDTIVVAAGTYIERATVSKTLTLHGAQSGVDARTRSGPETIVTGPNGETSFYVTAGNVVLDGFTIQGSGNANVFGAGLVLGAGIVGGQVVNCIIQDNITGIFLANTGASQALIRHNLIQNNNVPGPSEGIGIYSDVFVSGGTLSNVLIEENLFTGNNESAILLVSGDPNAPVTNVTMSSNEMASNGRSIVLGNALSSTIVNNSLHDSGLPSATAADIRILGNVDGLTIENNDIIDGAGRAIFVSDITSGFPNSNITVNFNRITGNAGGGTPAIGGIVVDPNSYTGTLDAENNWWGCNFGPGQPAPPSGGCAVTTNGISGSLDADPWLVLGLTASPATIIVPPGGSSTLTADLTHNSDGADTSAGGVFKDGTILAFATDFGTLGSATAATINGQATSSVSSSTEGTANATSTLDAQTVSATVLFLGPTPTPTETPTATATPTGTATATPPTVATATPTSPAGPLCGRADGSFRWDLLSVDFAVPGEALFLWRLSNDSTDPLARVDFRFVPGAPVLGFSDGTPYTSASGRIYTADVVGGPHPGIAFVPSGSSPLPPISGGQSDTFTFRVQRSALTSSTVLWNSASAGTATGRMDMLSSLCYSVPAPAAISLTDSPAPARLALMLVLLGGAPWVRRWRRRTRPP